MAGIRPGVDINGFTIREMRERSGDSREVLAGEVGVHRSYITRLELGHSRRVSPRVLSKLLVTLQISDPRVLMLDPYTDEAVALATRPGGL